MGRRTIRDEVKIQANFRLTPTTILYLNEIAELNNISRAEMLERIIDLYKDKH